MEDKKKNDSENRSPSFPINMTLCYCNGTELQLGSTHNKSGVIVTGRTGCVCVIGGIQSPGKFLSTLALLHV